MSSTACTQAERAGLPGWRAAPSGLSSASALSWLDRPGGEVAMRVSRGEVGMMGRLAEASNDEPGGELAADLRGQRVAVFQRLARPPEPLPGPPRADPRPGRRGCA